ncbi:MAG: IS630 family transposase [Deltaproteobacteria bacterium HGW-Deltaproteobacteria-11]|nr:MAG: IS630 family transposase [Deltaproteobacteria bacterium HGW-Deltaproteobacteria-11]
MARKTGRAALVIAADEREQLERLRDSRTAPKRETERAAILLRYAAGEGPTVIQQRLGISRPTIYKCIDKALAAGVQSGLQDRYHRPKEPVITPEAKAWVLSLACTKPKDHGLAAELWSLAALARYTREHASAQGHGSIARAGKATIWRILNAGEIKPQKVRYYLERRDAQFEQKMREVLMVYQEVSLQNAARASGEDAGLVITVSVDEKPGVQAIATTAPDLPPVPGKYPTWSRDHEYKRHGTLSILAAVDLHNGEVIAQVHPRHRSREFILLLKELDEHYPQECTIRVILDNHSAHISKETMAYLASRPNRFIYVHTPKHGSWLNLIETVFGKMARTFLKSIRVQSREELEQRILQGVREMNSAPVVFRWKKFDLALV